LVISELDEKKVIAKIHKTNKEISGFKIRRVYEKYGLQLTKRLPRKRIKVEPNPIVITDAPNKEWAMDFMSDTLENGNKFRTLNIIDHFNRKCLGIGLKRSIPAKSVIEILQRVIDECGKPEEIRTNNGPEFTSKLFQLWLKNNGIKWLQIQPGKPQQNGIIERFNRTFREEVLDANIFYNLHQTEEFFHEWIKEYNGERLHESLGYLTPNEYVA
jgi:putative transposase